MDWPVPSSLQVSRWSRSSVVALPSSNRGQRRKLSVSGRRCTAHKPTSWPRAPRRPPTPRSCPTARRWATAPSAVLLWFTTPSCTTSPRQPESSPTTPWAWRALTAWTPACRQGTTRPAHQTTCPGKHTVMARAFWAQKSKYLFIHLLNSVEPLSELSTQQRL